MRRGLSLLRVMTRNQAASGWIQEEALTGMSVRNLIWQRRPRKSLQWIGSAMRRRLPVPALRLPWEPEPVR